jgi:hypothetical protein
MTDELKPRLLKGLHYFWNISPAKWNATHVVHLHEYLKLLDKYLNGKRELTVEQIPLEKVEAIFK